MRLRHACGGGSLPRSVPATDTRGVRAPQSLQQLIMGHHAAGVDRKFVESIPFAWTNFSLSFIWASWLAEETLMYTAEIPPSLK